MTNATVIPLPYWQDPQGDVVVHFSERSCSVYFGCWDESGAPADFIGQVAFEGACACRSFRREFLPLRHGSTAKSYLLQIADSDLLREIQAHREQHYPHSQTIRGPLWHFVVVGHDIYHEVAATGFTTHSLRRDQLSDPQLRRLLEST